MFRASVHFNDESSNGRIFRTYVLSNFRQDPGTNVNPVQQINFELNTTLSIKKLIMKTRYIIELK